MARKAPTDEFGKLLEELQAERQHHLEALSEIEETFQRYGIDPDQLATPGGPARKKRGAKKAGKKAGQRKSKGRRRRGRFSQTAEESVLGFIKQHGKPNAAEVNAHWQKEGRGGKADNTLSKLVRDSKIKRVQAKGERGGRYQLA